MACKSGDITNFQLKYRHELEYNPYIYIDTDTYLGHNLDAGVLKMPPGGVCTVHISDQQCRWYTNLNEIATQLHKLPLD